MTIVNEATYQEYVCPLELLRNSRLRKNAFCLLANSLQTNICLKTNSIYYIDGKRVQAFRAHLAPSNMM